MGLIGTIVFVVFVVIFPLFFGFFFSSSTSSSEESIFFFTDGNLISNAIESEKNHDGSWVDYLAMVFTIGNFNPDRIKRIDMDEMASNISAGNYDELLGGKEENYEKIREYFNLIYQDLASVETELVKYLVDEEGTEIFIEVKKTKYHNYYPIANGYDHTVNNNYGLETGRTDNLGISIIANTDTPIVACPLGVVTSITEDSEGFSSITIRDNIGRDWVYIDVGSLEADISVGSQVTAGSILGYFGDRELFIKIGVNYQKTDTIWINPYGILAFLKENVALLLEN